MRRFGCAAFITVRDPSTGEEWEYACRRRRWNHRGDHRALVRWKNTRGGKVKP